MSDGGKMRGTGKSSKIMWAGEILAPSLKKTTRRWGFIRGREGDFLERETGGGDG